MVITLRLGTPQGYLRSWSGALTAGDSQVLAVMRWYADRRAVGDVAIADVVEVGDQLGGLLGGQTGDRVLGGQCPERLPVLHAHALARHSDARMVRREDRGRDERNGNQDECDDLRPSDGP